MKHLEAIAAHALAIAATVFAERNGFDNYLMVELYDPAEAPGLIYRSRENQ